MLPAGPSVADEVANSALWLGLLRGLHDQVGDVTRALDFDVARENFLTAARGGLEARLGWLGNESFSAGKLLLAELIPLAEKGLRALDVRDEDVDRYLGIVRQRVESKQTGASWMLGSLAELEGGNQSAQLACLALASIEHQKGGRPGHTWPFASLESRPDSPEHYTRVADLMTTDLFTVNEDDAIDLVASLMDWRHIRHVPVEDHHHHLVGLVTHRRLLRVMADRQFGSEAAPVAVRDVMQRDVVITSPDCTTFEAMGLMKSHRVACLPVVENQRLVGIISERDFMKIAYDLMKSFFGQ